MFFMKKKENGEYDVAIAYWVKIFPSINKIIKNSLKINVIKYLNNFSENKKNPFFTQNYSISFQNFLIIHKYKKAP